MRVKYDVLASTRALPPRRALLFSHSCQVPFAAQQLMEDWELHRSAAVTQWLHSLDSRSHHAAPLARASSLPLIDSQWSHGRLWSALPCQRGPPALLCAAFKAQVQLYAVLMRSPVYSVHTRPFPHTDRPQVRVYCTCRFPRHATGCAGQTRTPKHEPSTLSFGCVQSARSGTAVHRSRRRRRARPPLRAHRPATGEPSAPGQG